MLNVTQNTSSSQLSVLVLASVEAGFPSPAGDYLETPLDLNELIISRPASTFFIRTRGESMVGAGIQDGDLLVVDRSSCLEPANAAYPPITIDAQSETEIWGVVSYVIHKAR